MADEINKNKLMVFPLDYHLDEGVFIAFNAALPSYDYSDGDEVEARICEIIRTATDRSVLSLTIRTGITDWPSEYHLSSKRANLLRPFSKQLAGKRILEVGAGCGAISRYLGELTSEQTGGSVVSLESSLRRARIARLRTADLPSVHVVSGNVLRFTSDDKFDVIILVGVLEYARIFQSSSESPELELLSHLASLLRPGGLLLLAIENQLGLKYFAGAPEDHADKPYFGINGYYNQHTPTTFGRGELGKLLCDAGFITQNTYLPFPDYKLAQTIFSPHGISYPGFLSGHLAAETVRPTPGVQFSLQKTLPIVAANGLLEDLSNSFLIAACLPGPSVYDVGPELAWYYTLDRHISTVKETIFVVELDVIRVKRRRLLPYTEKFDLPLTNELTTETYEPHPNWWFRLVDILGRPGWSLEEVVQWAGVWFRALSAELGGLTLASGTLIDGALVDASPRNLIVPKSGPPKFIDQEWRIKAQIPFGFVVTRCLRDSLYHVAHIGPPADANLNSIDQIVLAVLTQCDLFLVESDLRRYAELDHMMQSWVHGSLLPHSFLGTPNIFTRPLIQENSSFVLDKLKSDFAQLQTKADTLEATLTAERQQHEARQETLRVETQQLSNLQVESLNKQVELERILTSEQNITRDQASIIKKQDQDFSEKDIMLHKKSEECEILRRELISERQKTVNAQNDFVAERSHREHEQARLTAERAQSAQLRSELSVSLQQMQAARERSNVLHQDRVVLLSEVNGLRAHESRLIADLNVAREKSNLLHSDLHSIREHNASVEHLYSGVMHSTAWRLTAPLRWIARRAPRTAWLARKFIQLKR